MSFVEFLMTEGNFSFRVFVQGKQDQDSIWVGWQ